MIFKNRDLTVFNNAFEVSIQTCKLKKDYHGQKTEQLQSVLLKLDHYARFSSKQNSTLNISQDESVLGKVNPFYP